MLLEDVDGLLRQPENDRLEFKVDIGEPRRIARDLAAFANAQGGLLIVGVDQRDGESIARGVDVQRTATLIERAAAMIRPSLVYHGHELTYRGLHLYAVEIPEQSGKPFDVGGQLYVRRAERSVAATSELIKSLVVQRDESPGHLLAQLESFAEALARQGSIIERLEQSSTWQRQLFWTMLGAVLGTVLGVVATLLIGS